MSRIYPIGDQLPYPADPYRVPRPITGTPHYDPAAAATEALNATLRAQNEGLRLLTDMVRDLSRRVSELEQRAAKA
jgi:hypothetical protein